MEILKCLRNIWKRFVTLFIQLDKIQTDGRLFKLNTFSLSQEMYYFFLSFRCWFQLSGNLIFLERVRDKFFIWHTLFCILFLMASLCWNLFLLFTGYIFSWINFSCLFFLLLKLCWSNLYIHFANVSTSFVN